MRPHRVASLIPICPRPPMRTTPTFTGPPASGVRRSIPHTIRPPPAALAGDEYAEHIARERRSVVSSHPVWRFIDVGGYRFRSCDHSSFSAHLHSSQCLQTVDNAADTNRPAHVFLPITNGYYAPYNFTAGTRGNRPARTGGYRNGDVTGDFNFDIMRSGSRRVISIDSGGCLADIATADSLCLLLISYGFGDADMSSRQNASLNIPIFIPPIQPHMPRAWMKQSTPFPHKASAL